RVARQAVFHAVPGILHRGLGFLPAEARLALCTVPATLELRLGFRRPGSVGARGARLGAIAVGRLVILVAEAVLVVVGLVVLLREVLVGVLVGAIGAVGARVRVLHGGTGGIPVEARLAAGLVPARLQLRLRLVPGARAGLVAVFRTHA